MQNNIPYGFVSVDDAIALINSDTRKDAKVDTAFLVRNLPYLRVDGNYTIKKMKHQDGRVVADGETFVHISSEYEKAMLEHAITEHYRTVTGNTIKPEEIGLRSMTTTIDEDSNMTGRPMANTKSTTKFGDELKTGVQNA